MFLQITPSLHKTLGKSLVMGTAIGYFYAFATANMDLVFYLSISVFIQVLLLVCFQECYCQRRRLSLASLRQPFLTNSDDQSVQLHRIDATAKDAAEGFNTCTVCAFDNFKRARFCLLCGEQICQGSDIESMAQERPKPVHQLTKRQLRVRKRIEWRRKVDVDGRLFWYRNCLHHQGSLSVVANGALRHGWTIQFEWDHVESQTDDCKPIVNEGAMNLAAVLQCCESLRFRLVKSTVANAVRFPNGQELSPQALEHFRQTAALDFPSRYSHFVVHTASSLVPAEVEYLKLSVHRDYILEESIGHLSCVKPSNTHSIVRIDFLDENGIDAGGLHREWFSLMNDKLTEKRVGLLSCTNHNDQSYYLNPNSRVENGDEHLVYFYAVGRLVGRALLEGTVLNFHFAVPLLKIILGIPVSFDDLEYLDEEAYRSLVWLLEHDHVEELGLDFSVCEVMEPHDVEGVQRVEVVDLIPDGRNVAVTDANKFEFVKRKFEFMVFESVSSQLYVFLRGVYEIIPLELLMLFDHEELDYILCGEQEIDAEQWERYAQVSDSLKNSSTLKWFWEVVREMPKEYRIRLLQFATGSSHLPPSGFQGLTSYDGRLCPFSLRGVTNQKNRCVHAHACFNRIDLPFYRSKNELKTVLYAILDTETYGFNES